MVYGYKKMYSSYENYTFLFLPILRRIPILIRLIRRLLPPYDRKGRVTPVTGISPTTTIRFKMV